MVGAMNQVSTELDSLSLLFASGVRESVAFDRDMLAMQAEAAHAKARGVTNSFGVLLLTLVSILLKAAFRVLIVIVILWLIGVLFPYVAAALGMPQRTVYELVEPLVRSLQEFFSRMASTPAFAI
jgi:hypothetical protein